MTLEEAIEIEYSRIYHVRRFGLTAFMRGWNAAKLGVSDDEDNCPYPDKRTSRNQVTFSRGYRNMWRRGYYAYKRYNIDKIEE